MQGQAAPSPAEPIPEVGEQLQHLQQGWNFCIADLLRPPSPLTATPLLQSRASRLKTELRLALLQGVTLTATLSSEGPVLQLALHPPGASTPQGALTVASLDRDLTSLVAGDTGLELVPKWDASVPSRPYR